MFVPSFIALSMSSGVATPSIRRLNASFIIGTRSRFTTNPGDSLTSTGSLPSFTERAFAKAVVASFVSEPRITSTSFITGAGLKKCMPMTRSGRFVALAISVMLREEVLLAKTTSGGQIASSSANSAFFASIFSMIASITSWAPCVASFRSTVPRTFARIRSTSSFVIFPFSTRFMRGSLMRRNPPSTNLWSMSRIATWKPAWEHTCAIPAPMEPAPITATFFTCSSCILVPRSPAGIGAARYKLRLRGLRALRAIRAAARLRRERRIGPEGRHALEPTPTARGDVRRRGPARRDPDGAGAARQGGRERPPVDRRGLLAVRGREQRQQQRAGGGHWPGERPDPPRVDVRSMAPPPDRDRRLLQPASGRVDPGRGPGAREDLGDDLHDHHHHDV